MTDHTEADYRAALRRAGLTVPAERDAVMLAAYRDFQDLMRVLDAPFAYADEPATALHLVPPQ